MQINVAYNDVDDVMSIYTSSAYYNNVFVNLTSDHTEGHPSHFKNKDLRLYVMIKGPRGSSVLLTYLGSVRLNPSPEGASYRLSLKSLARNAIWRFIKSSQYLTSQRAMVPSPDDNILVDAEEEINFHQAIDKLLQPLRPWESTTLWLNDLAIKTQLLKQSIIDYMRGFRDSYPWRKKVPHQFYIGMIEKKSALSQQFTKLKRTLETDDREITEMSKVQRILPATIRTHLSYNLKDYAR